MEAEEKGGEAEADRELLSRPNQGLVLHA